MGDGLSAEVAFELIAAEEAKYPLPPAPPEVPEERQFIVKDATIEAMGIVLANNPHGILSYRDELMGLLRSFDKPGHENDRQFYIEAWEAKSDFVTNRVGRGILRIPVPIISVFGSTQPNKIVPYMREAVSGKNDDGFFQRLQMMAYPDRLPDFRFVDRWPCKQAMAQANGCIDDLIVTDLALLPGAQWDEHKKDRPYWRFTPAAQEVMNAFLVDLESRVRHSKEHHSFVSHLSKYASLMPKLALLIHFADRGRDEAGVGLESALKAMKWMSYLEAHARRIYALFTDSASEAAKVIGERIKDGQLRTPDGELRTAFRVRDIKRCNWAGLDDDNVPKGIDLLCELNWLRESIVKAPSGGRTTEEYAINPCLLEPLRANVSV